MEILRAQDTLPEITARALWSRREQGGGSEMKPVREEKAFIPKQVGQTGASQPAQPTGCVPACPRL